MRNWIEIIEAAEDNIERTADRAIINLKGAESMVYTKLAQKVERISQLEQEIKQLKLEVKADTREHVSDLFKAEDETRTRVVNTVSFILTLSKTPKPTETVQYSKVLTELEQHLTPDLISILTDLKEKFTTITQKEPSLKITSKVNEGVWDKTKNYFSRYLNFIVAWAGSYDKKLAKLKAMVH